MVRAVLLLAVLLLAGCGGSGGSPADDVVGEWELVSATASGAPLTQPSGAAATLSLDGTQARGTSFCNHYMTGYSIDGDTIRFEGLGGTDMGCDPAVMAAESDFLTALGAADTVALDGTDLLLTGPDVELRFRPVPEIPTSQLAGTEWVLETLLDGEVASSTTGRSVLRLAHDGTFTGTTACHMLTGRWQPTGDELRFPEFTAEETGCPAEAGAQDAHELAVLEGGFQLAVEEDRLTALDADGRGLVYRDEGTR
jgi:heat shock protein HslJ